MAPVPVSVFARVRPVATASPDVDCSQAAQHCLRVATDVSVQRWTLDGVFGPEAGQADVHARAVAPAIEAFLDGYGAAVLLYGQTAAGKSWTFDGGLSSEADRGVVQRSVEQIFAALALDEASTTSTLRMSCVQVYNEQLHDLCNPLLTADAIRTGKAALNVRQQRAENAFWTEVASCAAALATYEDARKRRTVASHRQNEVSSRSHLLLTFELTRTTREDGVVTDKRTSTLVLADLAGSERVSETGVEDTMLTEAKHVNSSLFSLRRVIRALAEKTGDTFVPWRDSKLTMLLKDALGGSSMLRFIAALNPSDPGECTRTLAMASLTKAFKNEPAIHRDPQLQLIAELRAQVAALKEQLRAAQVRVQLLEVERAFDADAKTRVSRMSAGGRVHPASSVASTSAGGSRPETPEQVHEALPPALCRAVAALHHSLSSQRELQTQLAALRDENARLRTELKSARVECWETALRHLVGTRGDA